jgi:hypothetical protein
VSIAPGQLLGGEMGVEVEGTSHASSCHIEPLTNAELV